MNTLTPAQRGAYQQQMQAIAQQREADKAQRQQGAAMAAAERWEAAAPASVDHPYLRRKGVLPHGLRVGADGWLLVPLRDAKGRLWNLQRISPEGAKLFLKDGKVKGCYHAIGKLAGTLVVAEGFATAATIHQNTSRACAVAFNAGNLLPVSKALRGKFPCASIVIAADDDWQTDGNPGLKAATEAAQAVGGLLSVPDFSGLPRTKGDTDFNDVHRLVGTVEVQS